MLYTKRKKDMAYCAKKTSEPKISIMHRIPPPKPILPVILDATNYLSTRENELPLRYSRLLTTKARRTIKWLKKLNRQKNLSKVLGIN